MKEAENFREVKLKKLASVSWSARLKVLLQESHMGEKNEVLPEDRQTEPIITYIARLLAFLVLAVLHDPGMRAEHVHDFGAAKFTSEVKRSLEALEDGESRCVSRDSGGTVAAGSERQELTALSGVLRYRSTM